MKQLLSALDFSHELLSQVVSYGDTVVDCTVGNGHDTLFLANLVGTDGTVYGFDIQPQAIENTKALLRKTPPSAKNIFLYNISHSKVDEILPYQTMISAAIFNLGYLPGGDKTIVTYPDITDIMSIFVRVNLRFMIHASILMSPLFHVGLFSIKKC